MPLSLTPQEFSEVVQITGVNRTRIKLQLNKIYGDDVAIQNIKDAVATAESNKLSTTEIETEGVTINYDAARSLMRDRICVELGLPSWRKNTLDRDH